MVFGADRFCVALAGRGAPLALWAFDLEGDQLWYRGTGCESLPRVDPFGRVIVIGAATCAVTALRPEGEVEWNAPLFEVTGNDFLELPAIGPDGAIYTSQKFDRDSAVAYLHVHGTDPTSYLYAIALDGLEPSPSITLTPQSTTVRAGERLVFDVEVANPTAESVVLDG